MSDSRYSQEASSARRPATPPETSQPWQSTPGSGGEDKFLAVDIWRVGYMRRDGRSALSSFYPGDTPEWQGLPPQKRRRIGTKSLVDSYMAMLVSKDGALVAHLSPTMCMRFLDVHRSGEDVERDRKLPGYGESYQKFQQFKEMARHYLNYLKDRNSPYCAMLVLGPHQRDATPGEWMIQGLFNIEPGHVRVWHTKPAVGTPSGGATDRLVLVDYTCDKPFLETCGRAEAIEDYLPEDEHRLEQHERNR